MENFPEPTKLEKQQFVLLSLFSLVLSGIFFFTESRSADLLKFVPPGRALISVERSADDRLVGEPVLEFGPISVSKIRLNTAPLAELTLCPGIGPVIAQTIITERTKGPFLSWENFESRVSGMGPAKIGALKKAGVQLGP